MVIPRLKISLYGIIIVLSVLIGLGYIFLMMKKDGYKDKRINLFIIIYIVFAFLFGKLYTFIMYLNEDNFWNAGLSAYGGLVGVIIGAIYFEKIIDCKGKLIKYTTISLPLVYGLTKIGCFISGCCFGVPYDGLFSVRYSNGLNIQVFPIQLVESIVFIIMFIICHKYRNNKNITYITLINVAVFKYLLDYLRYDHININISHNQVFSIIIFILVIGLFIYNKKKNNLL